MADPQTPPTHENNCELPEAGRFALDLWYALALPPGINKLSKGVGPERGEDVGMAEKYPRTLCACVREQLGSRYAISLISTTI